MTLQIGGGLVVWSGVSWATHPESPLFELKGSASLVTDDHGATWRTETELPELPDDDITPDEAEPLPDEELVKTDPVPEEPA